MDIIDIKRCQKNVSEEQKSFLNVLKKYFNGKYKNPRILNICCGSANEEPVLFKYFGEGSELISIDKSDYAKEFAEAFKRKTFRQGDVSELEHIVDGKFDIVIGRNLTLSPYGLGLSRKEGKERFYYWFCIFDKITNYLKDNSTLFITLLRDDEFKVGNGILNSLDYRIKLSERNKITVHSDGIGVAGSSTKDHYLIIAQPPLQLKLI